MLILRELVKVNFERSSAVLKTIANVREEIDIALGQGKDKPIEHINCSHGILRSSKKDSAKSAAPAVWSEMNIRSKNIAGIAEEVFEILPLRVKWQLIGKFGFRNHIHLSFQPFGKYSSSHCQQIDVCLNKLAARAPGVLAKGEGA